eukprot:530935-Amphidinium_carterae.1
MLVAHSHGRNNAYPLWQDPVSEVVLQRLARLELLEAYVDSNCTMCIVRLRAVEGPPFSKRSPGHCRCAWSDKQVATLRANISSRAYLHASLQSIRLLSAVQQWATLWWGHRKAWPRLGNKYGASAVGLQKKSQTLV